MACMCPTGPQVAGSLIRAIEIPHACVVAAVIRGDEFVVLRGDTEIRVGDHVVFVGPAKAVKEAHELFLHSHP